MTAAADIANYWLTDPEAVTVSYAIAAGTSSTSTAKAKIGEIDYREMQIGGPVGIEPTDCVWIVGATTIGGLTFERGGTITDADGVAWSILWFRPRLAGGAVEAYRALCRKKLT